ncbi:MAG TPA: VOC family protein [Rhizomicrobium sp.]|nr:VOC family protein [Rhizomicrobium sp.]
MRKHTVTLLTMLLATPALAEGAAVTMPAPIVFFDIAGPDAAKLKDFYASNFGWGIDAMNMVKTPNLEGTLRQDPPEKILYIGVPDLDAAIAKITASGGKVVTPKIPIPTGTFVLFTDPAGNRMGLVQAK